MDEEEKKIFSCCCSVFLEACRQMTTRMNLNGGRPATNKQPRWPRPVTLFLTGKEYTHIRLTGKQGGSTNAEEAKTKVEANKARGKF